MVLARLHEDMPRSTALGIAEGLVVGARHMLQNAERKAEDDYNMKPLPKSPSYCLMFAGVHQETGKRVTVKRFIKANRNFVILKGAFSPCSRDGFSPCAWPEGSVIRYPLQQPCLCRWPGRGVQADKCSRHTCAGVLAELAILHILADVPSVLKCIACYDSASACDIVTEEPAGQDLLTLIRTRQDATQAPATVS